MLPASPTRRSSRDVEALAQATLEQFGGVHLVCNNAGVGSRGLKVADLPRRDFEWVIGVNLWGVINGIRAFLPHLLAQDEGHIVNTASVSGLYHHPRMGPYNATKAAVVALSETLRYELDDDGSNVGISVLCPSWVRTNITSAVRNLPERLHYELTPAAGRGDGGVQVEAPPATTRRGDRRRRGRRPGARRRARPTAST